MTKQPAAGEPEDPLSIAQILCEYTGSVVFSLALAVLLFTFVFRTVTVDGTSMLNTLRDGDRLILSNSYETPHQGDIIVLTTKAVKDPIVKRIIATAGQTVDINFTTHTVKVDGKVLNEPYIREPTDTRGDLTYPLKVPAGHVFVMGDNRTVSYDSRYTAIGMIDDRDILSHAVFRLFPFNKIGLLTQ